MSTRQASQARKKQPSSHHFDSELAAFETLTEGLRAGDAPAPAQIDFLRKSLAQRNNFLVSKAAGLVADAALAIISC